MPWTHFECPDGAKIPIEACIEKCRMDDRCVSRPTLMLFAKGRRPWTGKISTTQGLNGTRMEFLKIRTDYSERPDDRAFALLGTFHHLKHQQVDVPNSIVEERLEDEDSTGIFDFYGLEDGVHTMIDYKTCGGYKICRWQGKYKVDEPTGEVFQSGARKGQPKTKKVWALREPDDFDLRMQCSRYAWMMRDKGFPVDRFLVQATVRDYTKMTARNYGLQRKIYMFHVELFDRDVVVKYYQEKSAALLRALETNTMPPVCSEQERWTNEADPPTDIRCAEYCPVWYECDHGRQVRAEILPNGGEE